MSYVREWRARRVRSAWWLVGGAAIGAAALLWLVAQLPADQGPLGLLRDVGANIGPFGIPGALGAGAGAAAGGWGGGRNDPTGGSGSGQHPGWYPMPGRRMYSGGDGHEWYPSQADGDQYGNPAPIRASWGIYFWNDMIRAAEWIGLPSPNLGGEWKAGGPTRS